MKFLKVQQLNPSRLRPNASSIHTDSHKPSKVRAQNHDDPWPAFTSSLPSSSSISQLPTQTPAATNFWVPLSIQMPSLSPLCLSLSRCVLTSLALWHSNSEFHSPETSDQTVAVAQCAVRKAVNKRNGTKRTEMCVCYVCVCGCLTLRRKPHGRYHTIFLCAFSALPF